MTEYTVICTSSNNKKIYSNISLKKLSVSDYFLAHIRRHNIDTITINDEDNYSAMICVLDMILLNVNNENIDETPELCFYNLDKAADLLILNIPILCFITKKIKYDFTTAMLILNKYDKLNCLLYFYKIYFLMGEEEEDTCLTKILLENILEEYGYTTIHTKHLLCYLIKILTFIQDI